MEVESSSICLQLTSMGFTGGSDGKESACKPRSGRSPGEGNSPEFLPGESTGQRSLSGYIAHGTAKSRTRLSD